MAAAADQADFNLLDETSGADPNTQDVPKQWAAIRKILLDLAALWNATKGVVDFTVGADPDSGLQWIAFGTDSATKLQVRIGYNGSEFLIQQNTGSDAAPAWTTRFTLNATSGAVTLIAGIALNGALTGLTGLSLLGDLDLNGNDLLNAGAVNGTTWSGMDPTAHAGRHLVGGADGLSVGTPVAVGAANAPGAATNLARRDHVHEGLHQIDVNTGGVNLKGDLDFLDTDTVEVTRTGQQVQWALLNGIYRKKTTGDQTVAPGSGSRTLLTWDGVTDYLDLGSLANGSRDLMMHLTLPIENNSNAQRFSIRVYMGSNGNDTDPEIYRWLNNPDSNSDDAPFGMTILLRQIGGSVPVANNRVSIYIHNESGGSFSYIVPGAATVSQKYMQAIVTPVALA